MFLDHEAPLAFVPKPGPGRLSLLPWWKKGVIYQIYPRSFADSNNDGIGDLGGVINHLPYLKDLGVGAIWLSPVYPSPMKDGGYDVADYRDIDPRFGTLRQMDELIQKAGASGIGVIMDIVANHTSSDHPWFKDSLKRQNGRDNWYIWRDGKTPGFNGEPPNNWLSFLEGKSAWTYAPERDQWYLHKFLKEQPDLNLWNPEVQGEVFDVMKFWLDRGVKGFRFDVFDYYFEDPSFADMVPNPNWKEGQWPIDQLNWKQRYILPEEVYSFAKRMRKFADSYNGNEILLMSENDSDDLGHLERLYGDGDGEGMHLPFNLRLVNKPWKLGHIKAEIDTYLSTIGKKGWPNFVFGNHDNRRLANRFGSKNAGLAAMLLMTVGGTPIIYYGDEIGMKNGNVPEDKMQDEQGKRLGRDSRDGERTPMQWNDERGAGFTESERHDQSWLPIDDSYKRVNVASQTKDPDSLLNLYKDLIALREKIPALIDGSYNPVNDGVSEGVMAYIKEGSEGDTIFVGLNSSPERRRLDLPQSGRLLLSTDANRDTIEPTCLTLAPKEGCVVELGV